MFMKQALPPTANSRSGPSAIVCDVTDEDIDDDDLPMVAAAGVEAVSRAPDVPHASASNLPAQSVSVTGPRMSSSFADVSSSSAPVVRTGTVAQAQSAIGSKRSSTAAAAAAAAACNPRHETVLSNHKSAVGADEANVGDNVAADVADVLEIDDLDSLFAL
jgi:hypothetical protein